MDLSYVKKRCFKTHLTADDPLWKIFRDPLPKSFSSPGSVLASDMHTDDDHSTSVDDDHPTSGVEERTDLAVITLELKFVSSPPRQEPDITLFGRARFGSQEIDIMKEELCHQVIAAEEVASCAPAYFVRDTSEDEDVETYSGRDLVTKQSLASQQDHAEAGDEVSSYQREASPTLPEAFPVQLLPTLQHDISVVPDQPEKSKIIIEPKSISAAESSSLCMVRSAEISEGPLVCCWIIEMSECKFEEAVQIEECPCPTSSPVTCWTFGIL